MKVRLAAQTMSTSVAKALHFLQQNGFAEFENSAGTQKFIELVDRLFDIFISRTPHATGYKRALSMQVFRMNLPFLRQCRGVKKDLCWGHSLEHCVLQSLPDRVFSDFSDHFMNWQNGIDNHYLSIVCNISRTFLKLRRYHVINVSNQQLRGQSVYDMC